MELAIESRNVAMTPRWKTEIEARMDDLQRGHEDLIHGRVTLIKNKHHKKLANVEVRLPPVPPHRGVVCKLFPKERYGFILQEGGGEVYFHANALQDLAFERLDDGTEVVFGLEEGKKGPQATVVSLPPAMASKAR